MDAKEHFERHNHPFTLVVEYLPNSPTGKKILKEIARVLDLKFKRDQLVETAGTRFAARFFEEFDSVNLYTNQVLRCIKRWGRDYHYDVKCVIVNQHSEVIEGSDKEEIDSLADCLGYEYLLYFCGNNKAGFNKCVYHCFIKNVKPKPEKVVPKKSLVEVIAGTGICSQCKGVGFISGDGFSDDTELCSACGGSGGDWKSEGETLKPQIR